MSETILLQIGQQGIPPTEFRLFAIGENDTSKGVFKLDAEAIQAVMVEWATHGMDRMPIDYDHGMVRGDEPKAAGWAELQAREDGLWAVNVEWTPLAEQALRDREFRFISPAFMTDEDNRIVEIINVAITNLPATRHALPLVAHDATEGANQPPAKGTENDMSDKLFKLLGAADEGEALVIATETNAMVKQLLSATGAKSLSDAMAAVEANAALPGKVQELSNKLAALEKADADRARDALIAELTAAGKLTPALKDWATTQTIESLSVFGVSAPVLGAASDKKHEEPNKEVVVLTAEHKLIAKAMGISEEEMAQELRDERERGTAMRLTLDGKKG